jgi:type 1 glutamine amidotransferase
MSCSMDRRWFLFAASAVVLGAYGPGLSMAAEKDAPKKILFFTKSSGFEHSVIHRKGGELSHAEKILTEIGKKNGYEVVCSKDGGMFESDKIGQFDAFVFETTGDLTTAGTDKQPPMTAQGEKNLYEAVKSGKGFVGFHCATDTFGHHRGKGADDPYIQMIGGEFAGHGSQQAAEIGISDPNFPGAKVFGTDEFKLTDEWYAQKNLADDLHVIYFYKTASMHDRDYQRPNYPQTWARMHGKGRVFYNSMGHREDVWANPKFQELAIAGLDWATGRINAEVPANITKVTPEYKTMPGDAKK